MDMISAFVQSVRTAARATLVERSRRRSAKAMMSGVLYVWAPRDDHAPDRAWCVGAAPRLSPPGPGDRNAPNRREHIFTYSPRGRLGAWLGVHFPAARLGHADGAVGLRTFKVAQVDGHVHVSTSNGTSAPNGAEQRVAEEFCSDRATFTEVLLWFSP